MAERERVTTITQTLLSMTFARAFGTTQIRADYEIPVIP